MTPRLKELIDKLVELGRKKAKGIHYNDIHNHESEVNAVIHELVEEVTNGEKVD